jgi:hypothetical protein
MEETNKVETYMMFSDFPNFIPMFNPRQILEYGAFEGGIMNRARRDKLPPDWVKVLDELPIEKHNWMYPSSSLNYYRLYPIEIPDRILGMFPTLPLTKKDPDRLWFHWYLNFYYGRRTKEDRDFTLLWREVVLWAMSGQVKGAEVDQLLLHFSWNPGWEPKLAKADKF